MKSLYKHQSAYASKQAVLGLALARYNFSTPEIRIIMRQLLGHAISGRTIKRLARMTGQRLKRGRPPTTPRVQMRERNALIEATSQTPETIGENRLHCILQIQQEFGLTPRQYLAWVSTLIRRGKYMMRRCLHCEMLFPSTAAAERYCSKCRPGRIRLVRGTEVE